MKIFGLTIHRGNCPVRIRIKTQVEYREGKDNRTDWKRMLDMGHKETCVKVRYPNALHSCDCGLDPSEG